MGDCSWSTVAFLVASTTADWAWSRMDEETAEVEENGEQYKPAVLLQVGEKRTVKGAAKDPYIQKRWVYAWS